MYCQENHKFEKDVVRKFLSFKWASRSNALSIWPYSHSGRFYNNSVLKKVKVFYDKKRPSKGWSGVHLLLDNASSRKCEVVKSFLASEKVEVFIYPQSMF